MDTHAEPSLGEEDDLALQGKRAEVAQRRSDLEKYEARYKAAEEELRRLNAGAQGGTQEAR